MKIAVFTKKTTLHEGYGGLETMNKVLCEGLAHKGHEITVFSPKWELPASHEKQNDVSYQLIDCVYRMGPVLGFFGTWQKENWINRSYEEFRKHHQKNKFDVVLAQSSTGLGVISKKDELGIKVISIAHGTILGEYRTWFQNMSLPRDLILLIKNTGFTLKNFFRRQREFVHGSDKVIAVSNFVKNNLLEETFTFEERLVVVHNGIDPDKFFPPETNIKRGKKILYVGQIIKSKGISELYEMMSSPDLKGFEADLLGGGDLVSAYQARSDNMNFVGKVSSPELIEEYYINDQYGVFVFPTQRFEGFPMVLVEAMFSALPIVAYNMGGVSDAVEDGVNGFLIEPGNKHDFKEKVLNILSDGKLRQKMAHNSLKLAYENFTLQKMLDQYEQVMKEVTA